MFCGSRAFVAQATTAATGALATVVASLANAVAVVVVVVVVVVVDSWQAGCNVLEVSMCVLSLHW